MKGGGAKGLALAGAVAELQKHYEFDTYVGTSAGAITATLLATGYAGEDLIEIVQKTDFVTFLDAPFWKLPYNLTFKGGLYPAQTVKHWLHEQVGKKISRMAQYRMRDLPSRLIIYATGGPQGTVTFDSADEGKNIELTHAVRCSMSIPFFFTPESHNGHRVLDGGLLHNFPVKIFRERHPGKTFIALYLGSSQAPKPQRVSQVKDIMNILLGDRTEREVVEEFREETIFIDTQPINTTDFRLTGSEKDLLLRQGRLAALRYIEQKNPTGNPEIGVLEDEVAAALKEVTIRRVRSRRAALWRRLGFVVALLAMVIAAWPSLIPVRSFVRRNLPTFSFSHEKTPVPIVIVLNSTGTQESNDISPIDYVQAIHASFRSRLTQLLGTTEFEPAFYTLNGSSGDDSATVSATFFRLKAKLEQARKDSRGGGNPFVVTIGTGVSAAAFHHLADLGADVNLVFAGVTDPVCTGLMRRTELSGSWIGELLGRHSRLRQLPVAGVKYMAPASDWLKELTGIFPGQNLTYVYDDNKTTNPQDICVAAELMELRNQRDFKNVSIQAVKTDAKAIEVKCDDTALYFGWSWLDGRLESEGRNFKSCRPMISSSKAYAKLGLVPVGFTSDDDKIGELAAGIIEKYLIYGIPLQNISMAYPKFQIFVNNTTLQHNSLKLPYLTSLFRVDVEYR